MNPRRQVWVHGGPLLPGLEPVGGRGAGQWSSGGRCGMEGLTQTYRLQLNPKIMLIESKYISQLHFSSTIVEIFFSLGNNNSCISIFEHLRSEEFSGDKAPQTLLTVAHFARSWPPQVLFYFPKLGAYDMNEASFPCMPT